MSHGDNHTRLIDAELFDLGQKRQKIERDDVSAAAEKYARGAWTRVIWDVTAVAWLCNAGDRFMASRLLPTALPTYDHRYAAADGATMRYVYSIHRDALMTDLIEKICRQKNK